MRCGAGHSSRLTVLVDLFTLCGCGEFAGPTPDCMCGVPLDLSGTLFTAHCRQESKVGSLYAAAGRMCRRKQVRRRTA
ncbi:hypothetical protein Hamer_G025730 [Homarus americanus]|uniref:Secreted protein n=1 Tax=Homarus americanus TaxID=6706 RepID=A0A8J5JES6_HOMAM|nr:hypothetical protein Hamer_G025730 [Homarus americanus]